MAVYSLIMLMCHYSLTHPMDGQAQGWHWNHGFICTVQNLPVACIVVDIVVAATAISLECVLLWSTLGF